MCAQAQEARMHGIVSMQFSVHVHNSSIWKRLGHMRRKRDAV